MSSLQNLIAACQADELQLRQQAQERTKNWQPWLAPVSNICPTGEDPGYDDDFQRIREKVLEKVDTDGRDATLNRLQTRPGTDSTKDKWLLRLLMARVAEQKGRNELALHLLRELGGAAQSIPLTQWMPALLFKGKSRRLRLLRMKAMRSETDKSRLQPEMELLLASLITLDPASSAVLCG